MRVCVCAWLAFCGGGAPLRVGGIAVFFFLFVGDARRRDRRPYLLGDAELIHVLPVTAGLHLFERLPNEYGSMVRPLAYPVVLGLESDLARGRFLLPVQAFVTQRQGARDVELVLVCFLFLRRVPRAITVLFLCMCVYGLRAKFAAFVRLQLCDIGRMYMFA